MSMNRADEVDYMTDESEMGNAMDDEMEGNFFDTDRGRGEADDEYDLVGFLFSVFLPFGCDNFNE